MKQVDVGESRRGVEVDGTGEIEVGDVEANDEVEVGAGDELVVRAVEVVECGLGGFEADSSGIVFLLSLQIQWSLKLIQVVMGLGVIFAGLLGLGKREIFLGCVWVGFFSLWFLGFFHKMKMSIRRKMKIQIEPGR